MQAPETAWWEQVCLRLKIAGGSRVTTPSLPCAIVEPRGSCQSYPGEIQRETLSKTVGGTIRSWPTLTMRDCDIWGRIENKNPRDWRYSMRAIQKLLKGMPRWDLRLGKDPNSHTCVHRWGAAALLTKNSEAKTTLKEWEDPTQHGSQTQGRAEWRIQAKPPARERQARVWKAGAECLRLLQSARAFHRQVNPTPNLRDNRLGGSVRADPAVSCCLHFLRGKKKKCP